MKYLNCAITFSEFPDEISLCINISGCPHRCEGCHSPELWENIGTMLNPRNLAQLIESNKGITCVGFMGGDSNPALINSLAAFVVNNYEKLKIGWYSGNETIPKEINTDWFDYIKLGPYIKELGGLESPTTNQRMYHYTEAGIKDITYKFFKNSGKQ